MTSMKKMEISDPLPPSVTKLSQVVKISHSVTKFHSPPPIKVGRPKRTTPPSSYIHKNVFKKLFFKCLCTKKIKQPEVQSDKASTTVYPKLKAQTMRKK